MERLNPWRNMRIRIQQRRYWTCVRLLDSVVVSSPSDQEGLSISGELIYDVQNGFLCFIVLFSMFWPLMSSKKTSTLCVPQIRKTLQLCLCSYMWSIENKTPSHPDKDIKGINTFKYHVSCADGKISVRINLLFYLFFHRRLIQQLCVSFLQAFRR